MRSRGLVVGAGVMVVLVSVIGLLLTRASPPPPLGAGVGRPSPSSPIATPAPSSPPSGGASSAPSTAGSSAGTAARPAVPPFRHVYLIVMENKGYDAIVGNGAAPYVNRLIRRYGLAGRYDAVAHPSEPNYLALFSGSTQGVTDDGVYNLAGRNLVDQLERHGRTWRVFAQNVPPGCFTGSVASNGADGAGTYARKHEPAISFTDIAGDRARCRNITDLSQFDPAAADFELIVPNMCNDMHDCSVATGDAFLRSFVPRITGSAAFADSVLFITWDEGTGGAGGGGHVATLVVSPLVKAGFVSRVPHTHYSLLRTIELAWGLGCLHHSCSANDLRELFTG